MFGESWDEPEVGSSLPSVEPVRGRVFGGRGRGFLVEQENEVPQSYSGSSQGRSNSSGKWSDSESGNSGISNASGTGISNTSGTGISNASGNRNASRKSNGFGNRNASGKSKDHNFRGTSSKSSNWNNKNSFGKCSTRESNGFKCSDEAGCGDSPRKRTNKKSNATRYSDAEERYGDSPRKWNSRKSNASKSSDAEERYGDSPRKWNRRKSNASKSSDAEEGHGDGPRKWNSRKSNASKSSDAEERHGDSPRKWNRRKSNASKSSDAEERHGDSPRKWNSRKSNASKSSDAEERHGDGPQKWNSRKSKASKSSDAEERHGDSPRKWNPRKSKASKSSDAEERYGDSPRKWNSRKSNASKYSDAEEGHGDSPRKWNPRKSNASKYSDDEAGRYEDSPEDISNLDKKENMPVRKKQGKNGWNKESLPKGDKKGNQQQQQLPRGHYISNPDPENVEDLFSRNIASGINFDRYDDIRVKVTGENIPPKIERFEDAQICDLVMENIRRSSYVKPTPVQKHALPIIMGGRDIMACAQTGSGKTAAFLIPTINCMLESGDLSAVGHRSATPQLLIVTPTRELAIQIYVEAKKLTYGSNLITEICYGGTDLRHQLNKVQKGCNILIATCGRLVDFLNRRAVTLNNLRHLIIDEADKMLDKGFLEDVETIIKHKTACKKDVQPQILLFSATFPEGVQNLARTYLREYIFIAVGIIGAACQDVEQRFFLVCKREKKARLIKLLEKELTRSKTLVFVQHKRIADILAAKLSEIGFPATSMHGDREQKLREEALRDFRAGKANILVATAVASRGLDIRGISYVINYDLPQTVDEYVHRIGRTGRVGNRGLAISFYDPDTDRSLVPGISRILVQAHQDIPSFF